MKSREIFKLAVRLLGLVFLYHGLFALPATLVALIPTARAAGSGDIVLVFIIQIWPLVLAYWLVRGAPLLVKIAYWNEPAETNQQIFGASEKKADA